MRKVMRLVGVQLWAMLASMFAIGENKKKKTKALYGGFMIFILLISGVSFLYAYMTGLGLRMFNSIEILPSLFMALTSVVILFTTIFKVKGTVFGFKDYDMVMSLPVSNSKIVASRLILLYAVNSVFVLVIMVPMMIAYGILVHPGIEFYIYSIILLFFIPLIPIIIASVLGAILTYVATGFRFSNLAYIVFSFLLLIGFMIMPAFLGDSAEALVELGQEIARQVEAIYPLAGIYSKAIVEGELISAVIFITSSILAFLIFSLVVGKVFKKINTAVMTGRSKANYKLGSLNTSSPLRALYLKELRRYFASPIYVMNTGFGVVMAVLAAIALPFVDLNKLAAEMDMTGAIRDFVPMFITFCMATSCTTMAGVSIEGKNLWIIKSLPVSIKMIFASKISVNLTVLAPVLFASVLIGITMQLPFMNMVMILVMVVTYSVFLSLFGLVINLSFPNLTWTSETVIVKQSTASIISVFSGIAMVGILTLFWKLTGDPTRGMALFILLVCILSLVIYKWLSQKGQKLFEKL